MAKVNPATLVLYRQLADAGVWRLTASQLQAARDAGLGPLDECPSPDDHFAALGALAVVDGGKAPRLPQRDETAMALAASGWPCWHLPRALASLIAEQQATFDTLADGPAGDPSNPYAETAAEAAARMMVEGQGTDTLAPGAASLVGGLVGNVVAGDDPWAGRGVDGDAPLHKAGQLLATIASVGEGAENPERLGAIDPSDLAALMGGAFPASSVSIGLRFLELVAGPGVTDMPRVPEDTDLVVVAAAVRAATALVPLFAVLGLADPRVKRERWRLVAWLTPAMVAIGRLATEGGTATLPAVLGSLASLVEEADLEARYSPGTTASRPTLPGGSR